MIRAVLDSNVLAAAIPARTGMFSDLIERWLRQEFRLIVSAHILDEVARAWSKPYWQARLTPGEPGVYIDGIRLGADLIALTQPVTGIASHPEDDPILATALSGEAAFIVTGDKELLRMREFQGIEIVTPREFLTRLDEASST